MAMKKLYATYRKESSGPTVWFTPSYILESTFKDWKDAGFIVFHDTDIADAKYTKELAPGIPWMRRFMWIIYDDTNTTEVELAGSLDQVGSRFAMDVFETPAEAAAWLRANTSLPESPANTFEISPSFTDIISGNTTPAVTLTVN